jgi:four helix bundle protein
MSGPKYKELLVWQKAHELAKAIYIATKEFPKEESYGLTSQLRRAALSVPTNIVEGMGRGSTGEMRQFTNIALGSLAEVEYLLEFCFEIGYFTGQEYEKLAAIRKETGALLWKFYQKV